MLILDKIKRLLTLLVITMMPSFSNSFSPTGHYIIARIAERELLAKDFYPKMMELLSILGQFTKETNHPFVEASTWADEIKYLGWNSMNNWHYENNYVSNSNVIPKTKYAQMGLSKNPVNIVWAINSAKATLRNTRTSQVDDRLGKSIKLRMLIHLIGDIHQPLHTCSLVNEQFPKGDSGGNKFSVDIPGARNLHTYWDKCLKQYSAIRSPISELHYAKLEKFVDKIMDQHPRSDSQIKNRLSDKSVRKWANESVKFCLNYVYDGIWPGESPSESYTSRGKKLINEQLAVAGYRLADTLIDLFSDSNTLGNHVKLKKQNDKAEISDFGLNTNKKNDNLNKGKKLLYIISNFWILCLITKF